MIKLDGRGGHCRTAAKTMYQQARRQMAGGMIKESMQQKSRNGKAVRMHSNTFFPTAPILKHCIIRQGNENGRTEIVMQLAEMLNVERQRQKG